MLRPILCAVCFFAAIPQATAQVQINLRTQVIGKQRITDIDVIETVVAPKFSHLKNAGMPAPGDPLLVGLAPPAWQPALAKPGADGVCSPLCVNLVAKNWRCGIQFCDGFGGFWRRAYGPPMHHNPTCVTGVLTCAADGKVLLLTPGGTLFLRIDQP